MLDHLFRDGLAGVHNPIKNLALHNPDAQDESAVNAEQSLHLPKLCRQPVIDILEEVRELPILGVDGTKERFRIVGNRQDRVADPIRERTAALHLVQDVLTAREDARQLVSTEPCRIPTQLTRGAQQTV